MKKAQKMSGTQCKLARLQTQFKKLKKTGDIRGVLRIKALMALYRGEQIETVARCYGVSVKSLKRWQTDFEKEDRVSDRPRSSRPPTLSKEQEAELKAKLTDDNQRVWIARHVYVWVLTTFGVTLSGNRSPPLFTRVKSL